VLGDAQSYLRELMSIRASLEMQDHVVDAVAWLATYNTSLCEFILKDCLYSFVGVSLDDDALLRKFEQFEDDFEQFVAVTEDIDAYFGALFAGGPVDAAAFLNAYFEYVHLCRRSQKLLTFGRDGFSQREEIAGFVSKHAYLCDVLPTLGDGWLVDHLCEDLMARFGWITYPQIDIEGLDNLVYDYQRSLYLELSSMKLDFIDFLQ
jgi:hypothetical protein